MNNIECFNQICLLVFRRLYENFPKRILLHAREIMQDEEMPEECREKAPSDRPPKDIVTSTVLWLRDEGFISYTDTSHASFANVVLTSKGLAAMNQPIADSGTSGAQTIGEKLRESVEKEVVTQVVRAIINFVPGVGG